MSNFPATDCNGRGGGFCLKGFWLQAALAWPGSSCQTKQFKSTAVSHTLRYLCEVLLTDASKVPKSAVGGPVRLALRVPCVTRLGREASQLASLRHTKPLFRPSLRYSAASTAESFSMVWFFGYRGLISQRSSASRRAFSGLRWSELRDAPSAVDLSLALEGAEKRRARRRKGHRMSDRRERSERREFCGPRLDRASQGTGRRPAPSRAYRFFGYFCIV
jgi:hypothetical protein